MKSIWLDGKSRKGYFISGMVAYIKSTTARKEGGKKEGQLYRTIAQKKESEAEKEKK